MRTDDVQILHRGQFRPLVGAEARRLRDNVWEIRIPRTEASRRLVRGSLAPERFDQATFLVNDEESWHAVGSGDTREAILVTVLVS